MYACGDEQSEVGNGKKKKKRNEKFHVRRLYSDQALGEIESGMHFVLVIKKHPKM